jgi:adenosylhomocysteine nucleosidase
VPEPLVVVALEEEAAHLDTHLPVLITGVGKVNAALAVTRRLASSPQPSMIINLGTAGGLRPGLIGTHEIGSVLQHDFDSLSLEALTGRRFGPPIELAGEGLVLATGDVFVSNSTMRDRLAQHAHLVDMEGYAVAAAAASFEIPLRMVKHVSDDADHAAIKSWTSTIAESSRALAAWLATS